MAIEIVRYINDMYDDYDKGDLYRDFQEAVKPGTKVIWLDTEIVVEEETEHHDVIILYRGEGTVEEIKEAYAAAYDS